MDGLQTQIIYKAIEDHLYQRKHEKLGERVWKDISVKQYPADDVCYTISNTMTDEIYALIIIENRNQITISPYSAPKNAWEEKSILQKAALAIAHLIYLDEVDDFEIDFESRGSVFNLGLIEADKIRSFSGFDDEFYGTNY